MNRLREYASPLTKEYLIKAGVTWVDEDTLTVYGERGPIIPAPNKAGYLMISLYELDKNGNRIKVPSKYKYTAADGSIKEYDSYCYRVRSIGLHRVLWAWRFGKVPNGYIVDHRNNQHYKLEDYNYDNLQLLTQAENLAKERPNSNTKILKPGKTRDISFYEDKLNYYLAEYEKAKRLHDASAVHKLRTNISNQRAKIRYLLKQGNYEQYDLQ